MTFSSWDGPYSASDDYSSCPREPLEEKDAEIARLLAMIALLSNYLEDLREDLSPNDLTVVFDRELGEYTIADNEEVEE